MRTPEQVLELKKHRQDKRGPLLTKWAEVHAAYYGEIDVPLPELNANERPGIPNLTAQGIDQYGSRIGSTTPSLSFPVGRQGSKAAEDKSKNKRLAAMGWWDASQMSLMLPRRGRHLVAFGCSPVRVKPHWTGEGDDGHPVWEVLHPLAVLPAETGNEWEDLSPTDYIHVFRRPYKWLKQHYGYQANVIARSPHCRDDQQFEILEYQDREQRMLAVIGQPQGNGQMAGVSKIEVLEQVENKAGCCGLVVPGRITLDRIAGQFDQMIGMQYWQARLFALEAIAVEKGIFPDQWVIARPNEIPEIVVDADGRMGQVGVVRGGDFRDVQHQPGYMTQPTVNYLERSGRLTAGIPAEFGGESPTNVRTGRRGENVLSATIDHTVAESQKLLAISMEEEIKRGIAIDKAYHDRPKSFYVRWYKHEGQQVDYTPSKLWDSDECLVSYSFAGADIGGLVITGGQRVGMGTLSKRSFMDVDPMVKDPEAEMDQITSEALEGALLASVQQMASAGEIPPVDLARIMQLVRTDQLPLADAVTKAQEEAQARQATPVEPSAPEAQPGLSMPGMGAEAPAIQEPEPSMDNLTSLLSKLRRPQAQATPQELAVG